MTRAGGAGGERTLSTTVVAVMALTLFRWVTLIESPMNLQFDEAQYWDWSRHIAFGYVSKPPLIAWVIAACTYLFGDGEAAIRAAAPLLHAVTALALYALGARLYGKLTGFWCAIAYATLPSVAYSSLIISTDAVLLPFWAIGLCCWWRLLQTRSPRAAIGLGLCLGLGLLAKYAMIYFVLGIAVHLALSRQARGKVPARGLLAAAAIALLIVLPNLWWNFAHGWATFSHTAQNADWQGARKGGLKALGEFLAGQFGMFGPILTGIALWMMVRQVLNPQARRSLSLMGEGRGEGGAAAALPANAAQAERATLTRPAARAGLSHEGEANPTIFLLSFSIPVLAIVIVQCLIAGAHVNWAAPAYLSLTVLVVRWCIAHAPAWLAAGVGLDFVVAVFCCFCFAGFVPPKRLPHGLDLFAGLRGWTYTARQIEDAMMAYPGYDILFDERKYAVEFAYYLRNDPYKIVIWPFMGKTHSQFAMTNAIDRASGVKTILISRWPEPNVEHNFAHAAEIGTIHVMPAPGETRVFHLFRCEDLKADP